LEVNIHGSSIGNPGKLGSQGLIRNSVGCLIAVFAWSCGHTINVINVELYAIFYGLHITWNHNFKDIIYKSDSQLMLTFIKDGVLHTDPCTPLIDIIYSFILRNRNMS